MMQYLSVFEALGNQTRLNAFNFIYRSGQNGARPKDIIEQYGLDSGTLDFHLKKLMAVNLITLRKGGTKGRYFPNQDLPKGLNQLFAEELLPH
ncbi:winged helix-turn-helix domain-containing protein [Polynucleobacter sp. MWH-UH25E]|uniref:winged helix-turn-helix domain-containing protein n=1 Tax=Polynucleobacter sp. MWH-UH25E TaxID=1855616 RepID=UPI001BFD3317|nr:winged helix-turn-helix domain-containing protein [Polynucleobacter sp. MWH-UH25E]QWD62577.1 winged helix-turn-helix transcriptional regulator [Polynucleobacter sp. MWH-UH25E]